MNTFNRRFLQRGSFVLRYCAARCKQHLAIVGEGDIVDANGLVTLP